MQAAADAFENIAPEFDARFGNWLSVAAQRSAVRLALLRVFPPGGRILEIGGGTGTDSAFLAGKGYEIFLTDPSSTMVSVAASKLNPLGSVARVAGAEDLEAIAKRDPSTLGESFDGAFSNFAPLNCVFDLNNVARGLARLLKPGAPAMLVIFGTCCPGEIVTEVLRGRPQQAFRRLRRGAVKARLNGREFPIWYHRKDTIVRAFAPWFTYERQLGIGVTVPPSAAEPWISQRPRLLAWMEAVDRALSRPLAILGDHVLYQFRRTRAPVTD